MSQDNDRAVLLTLTRIHSHKSPPLPLSKGVCCPVSSTD